MDSDFVVSFGLLFSFPQIFNVGKVQQELPKPRSRDDDEQLVAETVPPQGLKAKLYDGYW